MRKTILFALAFFAFFSLYSQSGEFKYYKVNDGVYETIFTVLGIDNSNTANELIREMSQLKDVIDANIFYNRRCKIISKRKLNLEEIREITKRFNSDIEIGYCTGYDKSTYIELYDFTINNPITDYAPVIIPANLWKFPSDFPTKEKYSDEKELKKAKQQWIEDNPYKWRDITGLEYLDFSINLNFKTK